ncbi:uncharacterized protein LOC108907239 [Anoplophora glabripennis]|uniref:uncharacterized protein LOC108907239 n=1 Tax=Anoplophora glabripennis TaxID=217634 RepID=UPI000874D55C|nr:uncharacterized protein LOC108907239 [Anoplophora glabripennis]
MYKNTLHVLSVHFLMITLAFEDMFYVYGQLNQEMIEHGREQYQLLKERSTLPKYGPCWTTAVEHLNEGCRYLSEDTQSDIALHITNCFLEMSGHQTYNCELDKKPNLRAICINSMSDRAFNVYTEFYTHTQNICWFLRGQIWHETIAENTLKVGKQLEVTAQNQEGLLRAQRESLELQEKMLKHGKFIEQVLEDLYVSSKSHQEILNVMTRSISSLQAWIVGEISWIDSIIFYGATVFITFIVTSSQRTISARVPVFLLLFLNLVIERLICSSIISRSDNVDAQTMYASIYDFVWYSRYGFVFLTTFVVVYKAVIHKDLVAKNFELLRSIKDQNSDALNILKDLKNTLVPSKGNINIINESLNRKSLERELNVYKSSAHSSESGYVSKYDEYKRNCYSPSLSVVKDYKESSTESSKENYLNNSTSYYSVKKRLFPLNELQNSRYNLRSRQATPDD